jgi:integrase
LKLGTTDNMTLAEARAKAKAVQAEVRLGADPRAEQKKLKAIPTLRKFWEEQILPYIKAKKRSWQDDENRMNYRVLPKFGDLPLDCITRKEVVDFHLSLKAEGLAGATADHFVVLLRRIINLAVQWEVVPTNPLEKIALFREPNRVEHYLDQPQLARLLTVLQTDKHQLACRIFLFLLSTGARLNESLTMTWGQVDMEQRVWKVPASNSKSKKLRVVPLNDTALGILEELAPEVKEGWVFRQSNGKPVKTVQRPWEAVRVAAGLPHFRVHDLRHQMASMLINAGRTLYEVQQILGHSSPTVTQRYAHLSVSTMQDASATVDQRLQAAMPKLLPAPPADTADDQAA